MAIAIKVNFRQIIIECDDQLDGMKKLTKYLKKLGPQAAWIVHDITFSFDQPSMTVECLLEDLGNCNFP